MFATLLFLIAVGGMVALGAWKGGARLGLALAPLLICSIFLWIGGSIAYQITFMRNWGLVWPALFLIIPGLVGGYALKYWLKKKLPETPHRTDRIIGGGVGLIMGVTLTWLGLVYHTVWTASKEGDLSAFNQGMARTLNNGIVRWIPGIGAGSESVMNLVDIATADKQVQRKAIEDLGLDKLTDIPEMQAILDDPEIREKIESVQRGNILALWDLQKNPSILALMENPELQAAIKDLSIEDLADAVNTSDDENADADSNADDDR